jgi:hypothetical protein
MIRIRRIGLAGLLLLLAAPNATALPPGGVVRGGIRGAMVGGLVGGSKGARVGRTVGAVRRANYRSHQHAAYREAQARAAYRATAPYAARPHSNFHVVPPRVIVRPPVVVYPTR